MEATTTPRHLMTTTIDTARRVLASHGFTLHHWAGYTIRRDIPAYGSSCPAGAHFHRDYRSFHATNVSLSWVRRLADALASADAGTVTAKDCANAWGADREAEEASEHAGWRHRWACGAGRPDFTLQETLDLGVREIRTGGAARVAQLTRQVLIEGWAQHHPFPVQQPCNASKPAITA